MIRLKPGVKLDSLAPQTLLAIMVAAPLWEKRGASLVITSANDGQHKTDSFHYHGLAVDFRTKNLPPGAAAEIAVELQAALGSEYDVIHESQGTPNDHLHCEYDPA